MSKSVILLPVLASILAFGFPAPTARSQQASHTVVVDGYPYAARCPAAGDRNVVDRWGMYVCNCTSYVAWALQANGQRTNWFIRGAMNAWNWPHVARLKHIPVGADPRVGSIAVWPGLAEPFGHVAYVSGLEGNRRIDVAEYNLPEAAGGRMYRFDLRRGVRPNGAVFIYAPVRPAR